ncbi:HIT family protein [Microlunatus soli]|uniref:Diadenosine tetraphosphate (Ap4A) hydrolase n=1 Tax=Microlunatus soli TaxID=630515 RepID=A0A1H1YID6_9ACTN|nr:HIT domain-containing protein [Microlunatus soli]SDT21183.1 Diadenosine tetraphosphate (Ap4A) hydrolase [Microlunatus soli]
MPTALWSSTYWQVALPDRPLTTAHLVIMATAPEMALGSVSAAELITAYRRTRSALWTVGGCQGFQINFAVGWSPTPGAVGEPDPLAGHDRVIHVFGRGGSDHTSPARAMALPPAERRYAASDPARTESLAAALAAPVEIDVPAPPDTECDGCAGAVLTDQERWRRDGVRVIRPHRVMIDSQVLLLPLRHVPSIGDLTPAEIVALSTELAEVREQFALASGTTGLSCFGNDGTAARQETPHVHLHVFGRSRDEQENPFALLAARLPAEEVSRAARRDGGGPPDAS